MNTSCRFILILIALIPNLAFAELGVGALIGFNSEVDVDKTKVTKPQTQEFPGGDQDLEKQFGLHVWYEKANSKNLFLGLRGAYLTAEIKDADSDIQTIDVGGQVRYRSQVNSLGVSAVGAAGLTYAMSEVNLFGTKADGTGLGYHILAGGLVDFKLDAINAFVGLYYSYQAIPTVEFEATVMGQSVGGELEDTVLTRFLLTAGVLF